MNVLITCGPGAEPIDEVRRITNFSTGKLGIFLSNFFTAAGHQVTCTISSGRTCRDEIQAAAVYEFTTTQDLQGQLEWFSQNAKFDLVLHAAALSDYVVTQVTDTSGIPIPRTKIASNHEVLHLTLQPVPKLIARLRELFPSSKIVGWKYELEGSPHDLLEKAFAQIHLNRTDACVLNGKVIGRGFLFCSAQGLQKSLTSLEELASYLEGWAKASQALIA
ncbi:MAG: phosphopantothenoylcysteine decarboxylase [bacterium]